jgi:hypothetical protein
LSCQRRHRRLIRDEITRLSPGSNVGVFRSGTGWTASAGRAPVGLDGPAVRLSKGESVLALPPLQPLDQEGEVIGPAEQELL